MNGSPGGAPRLDGLPDPVLVVGGYGYRNVGDEAILAALLGSLEGRRVTVVSRLPAETAGTHRVRAVHPAAAAAELRRHRSVLIGGGGLFGRDMGTMGRFLPAFGMAAATLGKTVALHGVGIDPDLPPLTAAPLRALARRASHVQVRDRASADVLARWGVPSVIGPDLATWLPPAPAAVGAALLRGAGLRLNHPVVGLCLTALGPGHPGSLSDVVGRVMDERPDLQFCFIPMSQHPFVANHNDLRLAHALQSRWPRLRVLEGTHPPDAVLSAFGHLSAVVGMRYHSLVFAARAGVPLIPIPYADKCDTWLAERSESGIEPSARAISRRIGALLPARSAAS